MYLTSVVVPVWLNVLYAVFAFNKLTAPLFAFIEPLFIVTFIPAAETLPGLFAFTVNDVPVRVEVV